MNEELNELVAIYPKKFDLYKSEEYKEARSQADQNLSSRWKPAEDIYKKFMESLKQLSMLECIMEGFSDEIEYEINRAKEEERDKSIRNVSSRTMTLLNLRALEKIVLGLREVGPDPIKINRTIRYYVTDVPKSLGAGEERWVDNEERSYFHQSQLIRAGDETFRLGVEGEIYIQESEPMLRILQVLFSSSRKKAWNGYNYSLSSPRFFVETGAKANDFYYLGNLKEGLSDLRIGEERSHKWEKLETEGFPNLVDCIRDIVEYINAPFGNVPNEFNRQEDSFVRYNGENGRPVFVSRFKLPKNCY